MKNLLLVCMLSLLLISCDSNRVYEQIYTIDNQKWSETAPITFQFDVPDTAQAYNILYNLRYSLEYPYYNLHMKYTIKDGQGKVAATELQDMNLMHPKTGYPFGNGYGDVYDLQVMALPKIKFRQTGKHTLTLHHYMRTDTLQGIAAAGLRLEKAN